MSQYNSDFRGENMIVGNLYYWRPGSLSWGEGTQILILKQENFGCFLGIAVTLGRVVLVRDHYKFLSPITEGRNS